MINRVKRWDMKSEPIKTKERSRLSGMFFGSALYLSFVHER